jgi:23S rRNA (guanosine2251-2'-O)-methyltransferase
MANHQGIILIASAIEYQPLEELVNLAYEKGEDPLILILDGVTDVRNLGAIARSALAAGVHGILLPVQGSAQVTADAIRTSSGALTRLAVSRTEDLEGSLKYLSDAGLRLIAATEKGSEVLFDQDLSGPAALIMGSEDHGIHPKNLRHCDVLAHIPMKSGATASLNVSVASGIFLFEIQRQRGLSVKAG